MALNLVATSTQYIQNAAPLVTGYPFSIGMWVRLPAVGTVGRAMFVLSDTGTTNQFLGIQMSSAEQIQLVAAAGGTTNALTAGVLAAGVWAFVLGRFIASNNRRLSTLNSDGTTAGQINHASITTARAPTGLDTMAIGARLDSGGASLPWNGQIGEWWIADADVSVNSAANMPDALVWQLAYGGPFSVPYLVPRILEYRSFRTHPTINDPVETYHRGAVSNWTAVNTPTIGPHCPLPYWYRNTPGETSSLLMV